MGEERIAGVLTSSGEVITPDMKRRKLPQKQPGKHRWVVVASYTISEEQAEAAFIPGNRVMMDGSNLFHMGVGCYDCEGEYQYVKGQRCATPAWEPRL